MNRYLLISLFFLASCGPINVFEKNAAIPNHEWESGFKPVITFDITDTAARYNIFLVVRHQNAYGYNNIWIRGTVQEPGDTTVKSQQFDLKLANDEKGWLGTGMDDIFEHRVLIQEKTRFRKPGPYRFTLEHVMREDPLLHVMNVGLRIERTPQ